MTSYDAGRLPDGVGLLGGVPDLDGRAVRLQLQRLLADAVGPALGEGRRSEVLDDGDPVAADDGGRRARRWGPPRTQAVADRATASAQRPGPGRPSSAAARSGRCGSMCRRSSRTVAAARGRYRDGKTGWPCRGRDARTILRRGTRGRGRGALRAAGRAGAARRRVVPGRRGRQGRAGRRQRRRQDDAAADHHRRADPARGGGDPLRRPRRDAADGRRRARRRPHVVDLLLSVSPRGSGRRPRRSTAASWR